MSVLVLSFTRTGKDPRVLRQIAALAGSCRLVSMGLGPAPVGVHAHFELMDRGRTWWQKLCHVWAILAGDAILFAGTSPLVDQAIVQLKDLRPAVVIANDLDTLWPAITRLGGAAVIFDAHEYYPCEWGARWWRLTIGRTRGRLCRRLIPRCRGFTTVCQGIADRYLRSTGCRASVVTNAAEFRHQATRATGTTIALVHHGNAERNRRLELTILAVKGLSQHFTLTFYLVGDPGYVAELKQLAGNDPRIRFRDPVPYAEILPTLSEFDVGVFLLPPSTINYFHALPNKFFEFIQARLAVAIGPSPEMAREVHRWGIGWVADDFSPEGLRSILAQLTPESVDRAKGAAAAAARLLSSESGSTAIRDCVSRALATVR